MRMSQKLFFVDLTKHVICIFSVVLLVAIVFAVIVFAKYIFYFRSDFQLPVFVTLFMLPFEHDINGNIHGFEFVIKIGHEFWIVLWKMLVTCQDPGRCSGQNPPA